MKVSKFYFAAVVLPVFLGMSGPVYAATINTLFNTGVGNTGAVLPNGTIGDPHYTLNSVPSGSSDTRIITSADGFPVPPYNGDNTLSRWIGPNNDSVLNGPVGESTYRTNVDLTGFNPATASINGQWATDNNGVDILLNGHSLGFTTPFIGFTSFSLFSINSGFVSGNNILDFIVNNGGGPTALRVEFLKGEAEEGGAVSAVPVPAAVWLFGSGLVSLMCMRRKSKLVS
jgi:hypothetical protein